MRCAPFAILLSLLLAAPAAPAFAQSQPLDEFEIGLKSRRFTPTAGFSLASIVSSSVGPRIHVLLQLRGVPNSQTRAQLEDAGILLLDYVPRNAWLASVPTDLSQDHPALSLLRWMGPLMPDDKLSPVLRGRGLTGRSRTAEGKAILSVRSFADVSHETFTALLVAQGATILADTPRDHAATVAVSDERLSALAADDSIRWISPGSSPTTQESNRIRTHVQADLAQSDLGLSGSGVTVGIFENHHAYPEHPDLTGRLSIGDTADPLNYYWHSTNMAGIIGGNGSSDNRYKGMAPAVSMFTYDYSVGTTPEAQHANFLDDLEKAVTDDLISIASNSWGTQGCDEFPYGSYEGLSSSLDGAVRGEYGRRATIVFSAGNERYGVGSFSDATQHPPDQHCLSHTDPPYDNYQTLNHPKSAKNIIVVGAVDSYNDAMSTYSSWVRRKMGARNRTSSRPGIMAAPTTAA